MGPLYNKVQAQSFYSNQGPDILRTVQLTGNNSYCINPIQLNSAVVDSFSNLLPQKNLQFSKAGFTISAVPIQILYNYNSTIAAGINQGNLIPNRGNQKLYSGGVRINWKNKITIQIKNYLYNKLQK